LTDYLIDNGMLIDATGRAPQHNMSVYVEANRIGKIGSAAELRRFAKSKGSFEVINGEGRTIMPGLVDCHVHPSYGDFTAIEGLDLYTSCEYRTLRSALACRKILRAGVTAMACPGGNWNINVALRDAVNAGLIEGPRIAAAARYIGTSNGTGSYLPSHLEHPKSSFVTIANTRDEMVAEVRRELKDGNDFIKVSGDGDTVGAPGLGLSGSITVDDLKAIAEIAHLMRRKCTIHARSGEKAAAAASVGFDWVIHASFMNEEQLGVLVDHRTPINPTLSLLVNGIEWGPELGQPQALTDAFKREVEAASRILTKAHSAGVMIMAGTDSGQLAVPAGAWHARELEHLMTYLGMNSMEAIRAGTINAAFALSMQDQIGTVEVGKLADILVVNGNPIDDIQVLQDPARLELVMKDGKIVDTTSPLPKPTQYSWEVPQLFWSDPRVPDVEYVRDHAKLKPRWLRELNSGAALSPSR